MTLRPGHAGPLTPAEAMPPEGMGPDKPALFVVIPGREVVLWTWLGPRSFIRQAFYLDQALEVGLMLVGALDPRAQASNDEEKEEVEETGHPETPGATQP